MENNTFLKNLIWRRAEKHFAPGKVDIKPIEQAIINAPSSYGIQPYHVFVITDKKLKEKLKPVCYNQSQITECHALFVFCAYKNIEARIDDYLSQTIEDLEKQKEKKDSMMWYIII